MAAMLHVQAMGPAALKWEPSCPAGWVQMNIAPGTYWRVLPHWGASVIAAPHSAMVSGVLSGLRPAGH
jgi:hypothetical protein